MPYTLNSLKPNQAGIVASLGAQGALRRRLLDMGITPGIAVTMRKTAPLGDPIEITLRGYQLSLRKAEAETIILAPRPTGKEGEKC